MPRIGRRKRKDILPRNKKIAAQKMKESAGFPRYEDTDGFSEVCYSPPYLVEGHSPQGEAVEHRRRPHRCIESPTWPKTPIFYEEHVPYIEKLLPRDSKPAPQLVQQKQWIDIETIRTWLDTCRRNHRLCGRQWYQPVSSRNVCSWLIDVEQNCLVPSNPVNDRLNKRYSYVALSYVWGNNESTCTTSENLSLLREPSALLSARVDLPPTIQDAMALVRALGQRYLWIDRLCIVQDDEEEKNKQLTLMSQIYTQSYFTLIAAQNDCVTKGLYGSRPVRVGPPHSENAEIIEGKSKREVFLGLATNLMEGKWYSRGWTFQEYICSSRRVVFHGESVNWECDEASWHEAELISKIETETTILGQFREAKVIHNNLSKFPDMLRYARLVAMFLRRDLTYPEDALRAFRAILSELHYSFRRGFITGLPVFCFDSALLWQPWTPMRYRPGQCTWSCFGWHGDFNSESWASAARHLYHCGDETSQITPCTWVTTSTVDWVYSGALGGPRYPVSPDQRTNASEDINSCALPQGWEKVQNIHGQWAYQHDSDLSKWFSYPILDDDKLEPVCDDREGLHFPEPRYLHCRTRRAFMTLGQAYESVASACIAIDITTGQGSWAGALRLNIDVAAIGTTSCPPFGALCELIEISAGHVKDQPEAEEWIDEWDHPSRPRPIRSYAFYGLYEFYNVLWIERVGEVAYRKALGRVEKSVWEEVEKEAVDITLG